MKKTILVGMVFVAITTIVLVRQQLTYPEAWDRIQLGMSRQEVYGLAGSPTIDTKDIKGTFWFEKKLIQDQELWIHFDADTVTGFYVSQQIGTADHFFTRIVRSGLGSNSN